MTGLRPAYVRTPHGQVHVRWAGQGPPVLVLHDAPGSSAGTDPGLVARLARGRTVLAPDLVGAGGTTVDDAAAGDLDRQAEVLAAALHALDVNRGPVLGDGAGAAVGHLLAARHPDLVAAVVALSTPWTGQPPPEPPPAPDGSGTHLLRLFDEVRAGFAFRPWWQHVREHRRPRGLPDADVLHAVFLDVADHGAAARRLAAAAGAYWSRLDGHAADGIAVPLTVLDDGSSTPLPDLPTGSGEPVVPDLADDPQATHGYVTTSTGRIHVRRYQAHASEAPPLVLLHANPGSGRGLEALARAMAADRTTLVWDAPGHGRSGDLPEAAGPTAAAPTLAGTYAPALLEVLDVLGVERCDLYGTHTGAGLAVEVAVEAPHRVRAVVLDGVPLFDDQPDLVASVLERYFVDITPDTHGCHIRRAWSTTMDMGLWWPWFNHTSGGIRDVDAYRPELMHRAVLDMLRSAPHYDRFYRAGWSWAGTRRLPLLRQPVLLGSTAIDPLAAMTPGAQRLLGGRAAEVVFAPRGGDGSAETNAGLIADFLDRHDATAGRR